MLNNTRCLNVSEGIVAIVGIVPSVEIWEALIIIIGFGIFASLCATGFNFIRTKIYHDKAASPNRFMEPPSTSLATTKTGQDEKPDNTMNRPPKGQKAPINSYGATTNTPPMTLYLQKDNLDTSFDAGGKVSIGLTASTIVSQWTWAATLLQSSSVASKYGISGSFWYAAGATIQILLFAMLSVQLKIRAPGAKTFLQVIKARFGLRTHIVYCVFALLTNLIVTAMLMMGGAAVLTSLVRGLSVEYATTLVMTIIGAYTLIGGLGATFYVSYFNTAIIYILMMVLIAKVYHEPDNVHNPLGSVEEVYKYVSCGEGPEKNAEQSYLTILSNSGLMFGFINIVGNFGTVFVDQSYWQSSVAAKPKEGVWGFLTGGVVWFAVPFSLATTLGLAYTALSVRQGTPLLEDSDIDAGKLSRTLCCAQRLLGKQGELLMIFMILMAITSTGAAEVIAVTSILVYDVYQIHLRPFRHVTDSNGCILCGKARGRMANPRDKCECVSMAFCVQCAEDDSSRDNCKRVLKPDFRCRTHGQYRTYLTYLSSLKNWCLLWAVLAIFPLTMFLNMIKLSMGWVYLFMGILIGSAVLPITLSMFWGRMNGYGMISGGIGGVVCSLVTWLISASTLEGGLTHFLKNTGNELPMLCGNVVAILGGGLISIVVSVLTNRDYTKERDTEIWESTRDIDNPLSPWTEMYARELNLTDVQKIDNRPSLEEVQTAFHGAKLVANIGAVTLSVILAIIWPILMIAVYVMDLTQFVGWVRLTEVFGYVATILIVLMPVISEGFEIRRAMNEVKPSPVVANPRSAVARGQSTQQTVPPLKTSTSGVKEVTSSSVHLNPIDTV